MSERVARALRLVTVFVLGVIVGELLISRLLHRAWAREDEYGNMVDSLIVKNLRTGVACRAVLLKSLSQTANVR